MFVYVLVRAGKESNAPIANIILEYGYLAARLGRARVAICRVERTDLPSDLDGEKLIEVVGSHEEAMAKAKRELQFWLRDLPPLAESFPAICQVHGYSGTWKVDNKFSWWRGVEIQERDAVYFNGECYLVLPWDGTDGSGVQVGELCVYVGQYQARYQIVNKVFDAKLKPDGTLSMKVTVLRRQMTDEKGTLPDSRLREELDKKVFDIELNPVSNETKKFTGKHHYRHLRLRQTADEEYVYLRLSGASGL